MKYVKRTHATMENRCWNDYDDDEMSGMYISPTQNELLLAGKHSEILNS